MNTAETVGITRIPDSAMQQLQDIVKNYDISCVMIFAKGSELVSMTNVTNNDVVKMMVQEAYIRLTIQDEQFIIKPSEKSMVVESCNETLN